MEEGQTLTAESFRGQSPVRDIPKKERQAAMDAKIAHARSRVEKKVNELDLHWNDKEQKVAFRVNHDKLME